MSILAFRLAALAGSCSLSVVASASAQTGPPNLEGVWKIASPTTTLKPADGAIPFTANGRKAYDTNKRLRAQRKIDDYDITLTRCSTPGVPRLALNPMRFKLWQRFGVVTFDYEWNRAIRQINLSQPDRPDFMGRGLVHTMTGTSKGHWEGDTLVAVTDKLSDRTLLDDLVPHTDDLKVTERFRLVDSDTLEDRITIEDEAFFSRPWQVVVTYKRQPDTLFVEDVCLDRLQAKQPVFPR